MDYSLVSNNYEGNIPSTIQFNNLNVDEIYDLLLDTQYLLLPSTTECLSLVVGEAQVCGCIPIVLETEMLEHDQFSLSHKCFDIASFNQAIPKPFTKGKLLVDVDSSSIRPQPQPWLIERVRRDRKQLSLLFGG
jgi:hypothetical protein